MGGQCTMCDFINSIASNFWGGVWTILAAAISSILTYRFSKKEQKKSESQKELENYRKEIKALQKRLETYEVVEQSPTGDYFVQKKTGMAICPICWPHSHEAIPIYEDIETGKFKCSYCKHVGIFNREKVQQLAIRPTISNEDYTRILQEQGIVIYP